MGPFLILASLRGLLSNVYLDLTPYHYLNHPERFKEFYFIFNIDTEKPLWVLTRYRHNQNLFKGLTNPGLFKPPVDVDFWL